MRSHIHRIQDELVAVLIFLALIWGVFFLDQLLPLEQLGLVPRELQGTIGIFTMPFLHGDFQHLMNNTAPLIVLLILLAGSKANSRLVVPLISLVGGVLLWLFGREALHIGASLLVFGLAAFLVMSGIIEKRLIPLLISLFVAVTYGSTLLMGVLPWQKGVSWEGHLFGGVAGVLVAWILLARK